MRSRSPLVLMEQLVMVLVFALAAALCLQAFVLSDRISDENEAVDQAVLLAQNAAETVKSCSGDLAQVAFLLGGSAAQDAWCGWYDAEGQMLDSAEEAAFRVELVPMDSGVAGLGQAEVVVLREEKPLFALTVAWQEVMGDA